MSQVCFGGGAKTLATPLSPRSVFSSSVECARALCAGCVVCESSEENNVCSESPRANTCVSKQGYKPVIHKNVKTNNSACLHDKNAQTHVDPHKRKSFSFLHWNIRGLISKLDDPDFNSFVNSFDFVCIVETFVEKFTSTSFPDYDIVCVPAVKFTKKEGRRSGGLIGLIRNEYKSYVRKVHIRSNSFYAFVIHRELFGLMKDVLYILCYVHPEGSPFYTYFDCDNGISLLEEYISDCLLAYGDLYVLVCGDLNSRAANFSHYSQEDCSVLDLQCTSHPVSTERHSQDKVLNNYGKLLMNMCTAVDLCILNGMCHGDQHGFYTFIADNGCSVNDYFLMSCDLFSFLCDDCELTVAERTESDHMPLLFRLFSSADQKNVVMNEENVTIKKFVWKENLADVFHSNIALKDFEDKVHCATCLIDIDINRALDCFNTCIREAAECMKIEIYCNKKCSTQEWYDAECRSLKREVRRSLSKFKRTLVDGDRDNYCKKRREYKYVLKRKRKQFNESLLNELLSSVKSQKQFWDTVRRVSNKRGQPANSISSETWFKHFKDLLTKETHSVLPVNLNESEDETSNLNRPISEEEVSLAIRKIKNRKASGPDGIIGEILKHSCKNNLLLTFFVRFLNTLFDKGVYPEMWTESIVLTLYKKGDVNNPNNYRGISLSNVSSKIYSTIINHRLQEWVKENNITGEFQAGFKRNYSTVDHMFTLMAFIQKQFSLNRKLYVAFIDFEKAFDSVNRSILWSILLKNGIKGKLLRCIMSMYNNVKARIRCRGSLTDYINCTSGVKQGDVCSPILFSLFINELTKEVIANGRHGAQFTTDILQLFILLLADDIALMSETVIGLQIQLNSLNRAATRLQLRVNMSKSNIIVFRKGGYLGSREKWSYNGTVMPVVNLYKYLGIYFSTRLTFNPACKDIASRAKRAVVNIMQKLSILGSQSFDIFIKLFDSQVQPIVQYGAELWGLEKAADHCEKLHLFALKRFLGVTVKTPNDLIYGETNRFPILINSAVRCMRYWIKLTQMEDSRLPRKAYNMLFSLDTKGKVNWATKIKVKLYELGLGYVWLNQGVVDVAWFLRDVRTRLVDSRWQDWDAHIQDSNRFDLYRQFNSSHSIPTYITMKMDRHLKFMVARFRLGISEIAVHRFRYKTVSEEDYVCPLCQDARDTDLHFVFECPALDNLRNMFIPSKFQNRPSLFRLVLLMSSTQETIVKHFALYLYKAFKIRSICCN